MRHLQPKADSLREGRERLHHANELLRHRVVHGEDHGILPIAKSTKPFLAAVGTVFVDWGYEWGLPSHGEAYADCGAWRSKGCLEVDEHNQEGLLEHMVGKVFIKRFKRTCARAECPTCYESWAGKEASKIEWRLDAWTQGKVIHVVASPPIEDVSRLSFEDLRRKAYVVLKNSGVYGGSCIFHPFREDELTKTWYFSPHFHVLGYGWVVGTKEGYSQHGWIVKNVGIRKTVSGTALYQLSHAGVHGKHHTITWFGRLSYNKLKVAPKLEEKEVCPICGNELRDLYYFGGAELPQEEGYFWLDAEGWQYKPRRWDYG